MSLPIKIGNYRFERNLGNGTFGKVKCKLTSNKLTIIDGVEFHIYHSLSPAVIADFIILI